MKKSTHTTPAKSTKKPTIDDKHEDKDIELIEDEDNTKHEETDESEQLYQQPIAPPLAKLMEKKVESTYIKGISGRDVTVVDGGKEKMYTLSLVCRITLNGTKANLSELDNNDTVVLTTQKTHTGVVEVVKVVASRSKPKK